MHQIAIPHWGKIKLQKSSDKLGSVCRWLFPRVVGGRVKEFCVSVKVWPKSSFHVFLIEGGQLCFNNSPLAKSSVSP